MICGILEQLPRCTSPCIHVFLGEKLLGALALILFSRVSNKCMLPLFPHPWLYLFWSKFFNIRQSHGCTGLFCYSFVSAFPRVCGFLAKLNVVNLKYLLESLKGKWLLQKSELTCCRHGVEIAEFNNYPHEARSEIQLDFIQEASIWLDSVSICISKLIPQPLFAIFPSKNPTRAQRVTPLETLPTLSMLEKAPEGGGRHVLWKQPSCASLWTVYQERVPRLGM